MILAAFGLNPLELLILGFISLVFLAIAALVLWRMTR